MKNIREDIDIITELGRRTFMATGLAALTYAGYNMGKSHIEEDKALEQMIIKLDAKFNVKHSEMKIFYDKEFENFIQSPREY